jgi:hypothetical protein
MSRITLVTRYNGHADVKGYQISAVVSKWRGDNSPTTTLIVAHTNDQVPVND